ncbi:MAG: nuclear transport factor 2 family protein [Actinomycetota bacterium]
MNADAERIARDALAELGRAVAKKVTDESLALFTEDALMIGSAVGESAFGAMALRDFMDEVHASPATIAWQWDRVTARSAGDVVWFFGEGHVRLDGPTGVDRRSYRAGGVLRRGDDGRWRFAMYHGSEPEEY